MKRESDMPYQQNRPAGPRAMRLSSAKPFDSQNPTTILFVSTMVLSLFLMRPSHIGEMYNFFGAIIFFVSSACLMNRHVTVDSYRIFLQSLCLFSFWLYLCLHATIMGVISDFPLYSFTLCTIVSIGAALSLSNRIIQRRFLISFISILSFLGFSALITLTLLIFIPIEYLYLGKISVPSYDTGRIYFPFTIEYGVKYYPWGTWPRVGGGWREAGIAQCIYAWALMIVLASPTLPYRKLLLCGLFVGILAAQSTTGFANAAFVIAAYGLAFRRGHPLTYFAALFILCPLAIWLGYVAYFDVDVGFASKVDGESLYDRQYAMENAWEYLRSNPFGYGVYGSPTISIANSGINLIASSASIGIIGIILILLNWYTNIKCSSWSKLKIFACVPIYFTMLTSQPLLDSMSIFIILMLDPGLMRDVKMKRASTSGKSARNPEALPLRDRRNSIGSAITAEPDRLTR